MDKVHIRKQGGAAIITIPAHILSELQLHIGDDLMLDVGKNSFTAKPVTRKRKRYTLKELLKGATPKKMKALNKNTEWFRDIKPVGKEIIK